MGSLDHYEKKTKMKKAEKAVEISLVDKESDFGGWLFFCPMNVGTLD